MRPCSVSYLLVFLSSMKRTHSIKSSLVEGLVSTIFVCDMFCLWSKTPHGLNIGNTYIGFVCSLYECSCKIAMYIDCVFVM